MWEKASTHIAKRERPEEANPAIRATGAYAHMANIS